ncbi:hypothetical protein HY487_00190 [Candidatus Woesearchaeota archaeon]|nr:hypothetical protein [Candidatus Woesearchaeota archaeon]
MRGRVPDDINESKAVNVSLASSIFVIIILTFIELVVITLNAFGVRITPWLEKLLILLILILFLREVNRDNEFLKNLKDFWLV